MKSLKHLNAVIIKCEKYEVFQLVNKSLEKVISWEIFKNLLYSLLEDQSVKLTCLSLPRESQLNKENQLAVGTGRQRIPP